MRTTEEVLDILRSSISELEENGVKRIGLFGSYARGEQRDDSDIDILIEFIDGEETYTNLFNVHELLQGRCEKEIEIVTLNSLSPYIGPHILEEVVYVDKATC